MNQTQCAVYAVPSALRVKLICASSSVAALGIILNLVFFTSFLRKTFKKYNYNTDYLYMLFLSLSDTFLCVCFINLFAIDTLSVHWRVERLFELFFHLVLPTNVVSRVVQIVIPYLLIAATVERWLTRTKTRMLHSCALYVTSNFCRITAVSAVLALAFTIRLPVAWSLKVKHFDNCTDVFGRQQIYPTEMMDSDFLKITEFHLVSTIGTIIPFVVLAALHVSTLYQVCTKPSSEHLNASERLISRVSGLGSLAATKGSSTQDRIKVQLQHRESRVRQQLLKQNIISTLALVSSYLLCAAPSFVLAIMEHSAASLLYDEHGFATPGYLISCDVVSAMFMLNSCLRSFVLLAIR